MISWPAANPIRWVKPSIATVSPSRTSSATASCIDATFDPDMAPEYRARKRRGAGRRPAPRNRRGALLELEVGPLDRTVGEAEDELPAGAGPRLVGLPDVRVGVSGRVVAEAAAAGGEGRLEAVDVGARVA